jgi:hypothetical protein
VKKENGTISHDILPGLYNRNSCVRWSGIDQRPVPRFAFLPHWDGASNRWNFFHPHRSPGLCDRFPYSNGGIPVPLFPDREKPAEK